MKPAIFSAEPGEYIVPRGTGSSSERLRRAEAYMCLPKLRQHPFLRLLQLVAEAGKPQNLEALTKTSQPQGPVSFGGSSPRRRAAFIDHSISRQQPFCTSLQHLGRSPETAVLKAQAGSAKFLQTSFSRRVSPEGVRLLFAAPPPVNNPFAPFCRSWAEAPKQQNSKHKPVRRSSLKPRFPGGCFQKECGFYWPTLIPSTTLLHFPAEQ